MLSAIQRHLIDVSEHERLALCWTESGLLKEVAWVSDKDHALDYTGFLLMPRELQVVVRQLRAYFELGQPLQIDSAQLDRAGWTEFQTAVWDTVRKIPFGETRTYAWVAERIGQPAAARAVGQCLRRNPLLLVVPCHRVVAARSLGGFMGADAPDAVELQLKSRLLDIEDRFRNPRFSFFFDEAFA